MENESFVKIFFSIAKMKFIKNNIYKIKENA